MAKYEPLRRFLGAISNSQVTLSFQDIEEVLGQSLPKSARLYPAWWANEKSNTTHIHAHAWMLSGYHATNLDLAGKKVTFVKMQ